MIVEFNAVNQEHSNCRHPVLFYCGSRPLSQAKLWCPAALRFRGAKARLRNLTIIGSKSRESRAPSSFDAIVDPMPSVGCLSLLPNVLANLPSTSNPLGWIARTELENELLQLSPELLQMHWSTCAGKSETAVTPLGTDRKQGRMIGGISVGSCTPAY